VKEKRRRLRINDDTMTTIVVLSLLFCVAVVVAGMVLAYFGVDVSVIVGNALTGIWYGVGHLWRYDHI